MIFNFSALSSIIPLNDIKIGDLIFRKGEGLDSSLISFLSDFEYSHIGVIVETSPEVVIIHATTQDDSEDRKNSVIKSSLENFAKNAKKLAVKRIEGIEDIVDEVVIKLNENLNKPFILAPKNEDNLYCTTLIERSFSGFIPLNLKYEMVNIPIFKGLYLFPKAFWELENTKLIFKNK